MLGISSLLFTLPGLLGIYLEQYLLASSMLMLVITSLANHQFYMYKQFDRIYVRSIIILFTIYSIINSFYIVAVCSCIAALIYKYKKYKWHHVIMHIV